MFLKLTVNLNFDDVIANQEFISCPVRAIQWYVDFINSSVEQMWQTKTFLLGLVSCQTSNMYIVSQMSGSMLPPTDTLLGHCLRTGFPELLRC